MSPKKTPKDADTTPAAEPTPPPAAEVTDETVETPAATPRPQTFAGRSRGVIAAGAVGLLLVGGAAGFGIGHATGDDDGPRFDRTGQFLPGHPGHGPRHPGESRDQRNGPPMPDRDGGPGGRMDDDFPPAPRADGSEDGSSSSGT